MSMQNQTYGVKKGSFNKNNWVLACKNINRLAENIKDDVIRGKFSLNDNYYLSVVLYKFYSLLFGTNNNVNDISIGKLYKYAYKRDGLNNDIILMGKLQGISKNSKIVSRYAEAADIVIGLKNKLKKFCVKEIKNKSFVSYFLNDSNIFSPTQDMVEFRKRDTLFSLKPDKVKNLQKINHFLRDITNTDDINIHEEKITDMLHSDDETPDIKSFMEKFGVKKIATIKANLREYQELYVNNRTLSIYELKQAANNNDVLSTELIIEDSSENDEIQDIYLLDDNIEIDLPDDIEENRYENESIPKHLLIYHKFFSYIRNDPVKQLLGTRRITEQIIESTVLISEYRIKYRENHNGKNPPLKYFVLNLPFVYDVLNPLVSHPIPKYPQDPCADSNLYLCEDCNKKEKDGCGFKCNIDDGILNDIARLSKAYLPETAYWIYTKNSIPPLTALSKFGYERGVYSGNRIMVLNERMINKIFNEILSEYKTQIYQANEN